MIRPSRDLIDPALLRGATEVDTDAMSVDTERMHEFEQVVRRQLELLGEDPDREG
jgi:GTP cyclohydrolase I